MTLLNRIAFIAIAVLLAGSFSRGQERRDGFAIARPHREFSFPADHGSHPDFRIEWWYVTGHLFTGEGDGERRFGFQATFFRSAEKPGSAPPGSFSEGQYYLAHMALSEPAEKRFIHEERINREGWDASARVGDLDLRNGNWTLKRVEGEKDRFHLQGSVLSEARFDLQLEVAAAEKSHVIFGEDGVSRKGAGPGEASLYITFPRLTAAGTLRIGGEDLKVSGQAWMDHEISSSQLGRDQAGWDWVSMQFDDGRELMAYVLRKKDGTPDAFSTLAWVNRVGEVIHVPIGDKFTWESDGVWESPETGAKYPIRPRVKTVDPETGRERIFQLRPLMEAQEIIGSVGGISYWEGACEIIDETGNAVGSAFLELTGYARDQLEERLR